MRCGRRSSWLSPNDAACSSRAPSAARKHPRPGRPPRAEPEDGGQVARPDRHRRRPDGAGPAPQHRPGRGRGSRRRRVPQPHPVAARRRPGLPARGHPGALARRAAPLLGPARHLTAAPGGEKASKGQRFAETAIGYVHIDSCGLRLAEGKLHMFLAIDRVTKFVHVAFFDANTKANGAAFLREVVEAFPYAIHTVLTDNGMAFADLPKYRDGPTAKWMGHIFDRVCRENGIEHRLTKPYHPWTNGQAERMNRTVKEATIKAFHYPGLEALKAHVLAFTRAYNFAKHLKALRWRTPFQAICDAWAKDRSIFKINPHHLIPGPNT